MTVVEKVWSQVRQPVLRYIAAGPCSARSIAKTSRARTATPRSGVPMPSGEPLELGKFAGVLDEVRIENPAAPPSGVAQWLFDGELRDSAGIFPSGVGFIAATSMNCDGNVIVPAAREIVTLPSSSG